MHKEYDEMRCDKDNGKRIMRNVQCRRNEWEINVDKMCTCAKIEMSKLMFKIKRAKRVDSAASPSSLTENVGSVCRKYNAVR